MRIGLDGSALVLSSGGLRRYAEELAQGLARTDDTEVEWMRPSGALWWSVRLTVALARSSIDVFHGLNFEVPYVPLRPAVMTVHDLSPWKDPAWHTGAARVRKRTPMLLRLGLAAAVITPTEAVRREAIAEWDLHPSRVYAVFEAAAGAFQPGSEPREHFILSVGTIEPRKNLLTLIAAWREMRRNHPVRLCLVGRRREDGPKIEDEEGLQWLGEVDDAELAELYRRALLFVYPSLYEGFGLPVLEAMQSGTAVIASRDPALMEVSAGAALHVDAHDERSWIEAMESVCLNAGLRGRLQEASLRRAGDFSWELTARKTREVYAEAIRRWNE